MSEFYGTSAQKGYIAPKNIFVTRVESAQTVVKRNSQLITVDFEIAQSNITKYSRLSLSRSRRDHLKHFEISVLRHIRFAELRKIPNEQPNFTNKHVI